MDQYLHSFASDGTDFSEGIDQIGARLHEALRYLGANESLNEHLTVIGQG